jgi:hypothetical protein
LRGFQAADAAANGRLLSALAETDPQHIYGGLIATLMRLVFLLYAEDEGLMPDDEVYQRHYAVSGLYEKLREDAGNYPDTMDQRYGAWAALLSLFRLVYDGGGATEEYLPARHGQLFDPDAYPYLEGRLIDSEFATYGRLEAPRIADGVVYRMLDKLLLLMVSGCRTGRWMWSRLARCMRQSWAMKCRLPTVDRLLCGLKMWWWMWMPFWQRSQPIAPPY